MKRILFFFSLILMLGISTKASAISEGTMIDAVTVNLNDDSFSYHFDMSQNEWRVYGFADNYPFMSITFGPDNTFAEIHTDKKGIDLLSGGIPGYFDIQLLVRTQRGDTMTCYLHVIFEK